MTTPSVLPFKYNGTQVDFAKTEGVDRSGASRIQQGSVTVPSGTAANEFIGLIPFNKGARFNIGDKDIHVADIGAGTTTINLGYVYDNDTDFINNPDAWLSGGTAIQAGGFLTVGSEAGLSFVAEADGWLVTQIVTAATDTEGDITFNIVQAYDG